MSNNKTEADVKSLAIRAVEAAKRRGDITEETRRQLEAEAAPTDVLPAATTGDFVATGDNDGTPSQQTDALPMGGTNDDVDANVAFDKDVIVNPYQGNALERIGRLERHVARLTTMLSPVIEMVRSGKLALSEDVTTPDDMEIGMEYGDGGADPDETLSVGLADADSMLDDQFDNFEGRRREGVGSDDLMPSDSDAMYQWITSLKPGDRVKAYKTGAGLQPGTVKSLVPGTEEDPVIVVQLDSGEEIEQGAGYIEPEESRRGRRSRREQKVKVPHAGSLSGQAEVEPGLWSADWVGYETNDDGDKVAVVRFDDGTEAEYLPDEVVGAPSESRRPRRRGRRESTRFPGYQRTDMPRSEGAELDRLISNELIPLFESGQTVQDNLRKLLIHWRCERITTTQLVEQFGKLSEGIKSPERFMKVDQLLAVISQQR